MYKNKLKFESNLGKIEKKIRRGLQLKMVAIKGLLVGYLKEKLEGDEGRTGNKYLRPDGEEYTASAPGEWPSEKSGDLRKSIKGQIKVNKDELALVMQSQPYGEDLESFMDRLFVTQAFEDNYDEIKEILQRPIR